MYYKEIGRCKKEMSLLIGAIFGSLLTFVVLNTELGANFLNEIKGFISGVKKE